MRQLKINKSITNRSSAALDKYLVEIGREELISTDEEVELAQRIHKGDQEALDRLTRANLRFVMKGDEKVLICTSFIPGEGKTFVSTNLAMSMALMGKKLGEIAEVNAPSGTFQVRIENIETK